MGQASLPPRSCARLQMNGTLENLNIFFLQKTRHFYTTEHYAAWKGFALLWFKERKVRYDRGHFMQPLLKKDSKTPAARLSADTNQEAERGRDGSWAGKDGPQLSQLTPFTYLPSESTSSLKSNSKQLKDSLDLCRCPICLSIVGWSTDLFIWLRFVSWPICLQPEWFFCKAGPCAEPRWRTPKSA